MGQQKISSVTFVALLVMALHIPAVSAFDTPVRGEAKLGLGNQYWSYGEVGTTIPLRETMNSVWHADLRYMNHLDESNSDSNEGSVGLIYRKRLPDRPGFWGINSSYSEYRSWHGNRRQTPHLGFEYMTADFSLTANYMFQDDTVHRSSVVEKAHAYHGDYYLVEEHFTGGGEVVARYFLDNRASIGIGGYFRHGEPAKGTFSYTHAGGVAVTEDTDHYYLLEEGGFFEFTYDYPLSKTRSLGFGFQGKYDRQNKELFLATFSFEFGVPEGTHWERAWNKGIYKADPDDFGLIIGAIGFVAEVGLDVGTEALVNCILNC